MYVVATAGHVDHGKSSLVRALTGTDPDRWEEEKRRGLTIDLGFAQLQMPSGRNVGIVDVPGHERFIKNMLAGVGSVNATIFVVAANEGWKPQSQEHLDILDLLDITSAIVAITKADTAGPEEIEELKADIRRRLSATALSAAPIVAVSSTTGTGLPELLAELDRVLDDSHAATGSERARLWIDRVFTIKGAGTVVTGTLVDGPLRANSQVEILPGRIPARVRSLQTHGESLDSAEPGNRLAVNLSGADGSDIGRGDVLTEPGAWDLTDRFVAEVRFLDSFTPTVKGAFKLYVGSAEADVRIGLIDPSKGMPQPGSSTFLLIRSARDLAIERGDRFVLRESGRRQTIGGGQVLEPFPTNATYGPRAWAAAAQRAEAPGRAEYLQILLDEEQMIPIETLTRRSGLSEQAARSAGVRAVWLPSWVISPGYVSEIEELVGSELGAFHQGEPLSPGMERTILRARTRLPEKGFEEIVDELIRRGAIAADGPHLRLATHSVDTLGPEQQALLDELESAGASPPVIKELHSRFQPALVQALVRAGDLVQISPEIVYPASWMERTRTDLKERIGAEGSFTVAEFRDLIGTTRKYAVPLLEYFDSKGFTRRSGDLRTFVG